MLDINLIRKNPELVKKGIVSKGVNPELVDKFLNIDLNWRKLTKEIDDLRARQKTYGAEDKEKGALETKKQIKQIEEDLKKIESERDKILLQMPNLPLNSVTVGKDEKDNRIIKEVGDKPIIKNPKDYLTLAKELDLIDIERAAKVSGSRFGYLKGAAARLEFALIDLAIKILTKEGFVLVIPPVMVNEKSMRGMGYIERGEEEIYHLPKDNFYLVGTSEQSVAPMHQD